MNTQTLLPLSAAALFALCAGAMFVSASQSSDNIAPAAPAATVAADRIVTLPTVSVRPDADDLAHYLAYRDVKTVDLATVTVHPESDDLAAYLSRHTAHITDLPAVTVRPSVQDMQHVARQAGALAAQLASR